MPVYRLTEALRFPPPERAEPDGLLAVGGDLSPRRLILAYCSGIFPWPVPGAPLLWFSPDPRCVLFPKEFRLPRSTRSAFRKGRFTLTLDRAFPDVMAECARIRHETGEGTWILPAMIEAYTRLHHLGIAHSVETWEKGALAGGLYGIALGRAFFGESMFSRAPEASKAALARLAETLTARSFHLIDCQMTTPHLLSLGAREIPRAEFLARLRAALADPVPPGTWED